VRAFDACFSVLIRYVLLARSLARGLMVAAFQTSDLPLLVYFENHCTLAHQPAVVAALQETFGEHDL
jgi:predicted nucleotidyltransferase